MKIVGIVAEYNPFHKGHAYHIAEAKRLSGADCCVVVMSGYFVQRGEPAVYDPYTRAGAALEEGADAVIAMPALFSCASAELFAGYGAGLLDDLGCDGISFGIESGDSGLHDAIARILTEEPEDFRRILRERLKSGESFAEARMEAVRACLPQNVRTEKLPDQPNQILALEYRRALMTMKSSMEIIPVRRMGHGYHDIDTGDGSYPSATAVRAALRESRAGGCIFADDIWPMILAVVMSKLRAGENLTAYEDVSPEIANRMAGLTGKACCTDMGSFIAELKTRQYTYTRIARCLTHIFLDHRTSDMEAARSAGRYAFVLGMRRDDGGLMSELKRRSRVPIISKAADGTAVIERYYGGVDACRNAGIIRSVFEHDIYASRLYAAAYMCRYGRELADMYRSRVVVL